MQPNDPPSAPSSAAAEPLPTPLAALLDRFRAGQRLGLARAISVVEDERPGFQDFLHAVLAARPRARRVGFTGPPGAGKSTLLAAMARTGLSRRSARRTGVTRVVHGL